MNWIPPLAVVAATLIVLFFPASFHATEIRAIASAQDRTLPSGTRIGIFDKGDPRNDEANQLEWYGNDVPIQPYTPAELEAALRSGSIRVFVLDRETYENRFRSLPHDVIAQAGRLVTVHLK